MWMLLACAPNLPPESVAAPLPPRTVRVRIEEHIALVYQDPPEGQDLAGSLSVSWRGAEVRTALGATRLAEGPAPANIAMLTCEVRGGELFVEQREGAIATPLPRFGWCGPPMGAGSVLFRVEVDRVGVTRLE